ncbi:MAG TPA: R3H domain-containing nucleic acid-binding protein [Thermoanaerobaculia bacterium]|jgi:spoIIIJ-associated protein
MSEPKRRFFSGDSLRQALVQAANYHQLDPDQIAYRSIDKRHGFLKTRRRVMIEVDPDAPRLAPGAPAPARVPAAPAAPAVAVVAAPHTPAPIAPPPDTASLSPRPVPRPSEPQGNEGGRPRTAELPPRAPSPEPRPSIRREEPRPSRPPAGGDREEGLIALPEQPRRASERYPPATGAQAEAAQKGLDLILGIAGLDLAARIHQGEDRLEIDLTGPGAERCFEDEGELLMSIEHLLPRVIRTLCGETVPCRVDCDNFHEIREEQLRTLAQRVAEEVRRRGRPRTLEPMNPSDRRVVHMTLADDPHVETESDGEGYFKRITVRPT